MINSPPSEGKAQIACDYYVAQVLTSVMKQTHGRLLAELDREMWKMGMNVSDKTRISPAFNVIRDEEGRITKWFVDPGRLWFPKSFSSYAGLWNALSGGGDYRELLHRQLQDPITLELAMENVSKVYQELLGEMQYVKRMPLKVFRPVFMRKWLRDIADSCGIAPLIRACLEGVPADDILA